MPSEEYIVVGKLGRTRGVHGEINVTPETDFPERFEGLTEIYVQNRGAWEKFRLASTKYVSGRPVLRFEGIDNPEDASRFTNRLLAVPRSEVVELPENTYFIFDLVGCRVLEEGTLRVLGEVVDVEQYPANDVFVIKTASEREVLFPAVKEMVRDVDIANRTITVVPADLFGGKEG